jgi:hypothetical protein
MEPCGGPPFETRPSGAPQGEDIRERAPLILRSGLQGRVSKDGNAHHYFISALDRCRILSEAAPKPVSFLFTP